MLELRVFFNVQSSGCGWCREGVAVWVASVALVVGVYWRGLCT